MKKVDTTIFKIFMMGLPPVLILALATNAIESLNHISFINSLSGVIFGIWMILALYLSLRLIISTEFRTNVLSKVSFFKERDEREAAVTAAATRNSFLTTLAVLILFLCLSMFQVAVYKLPPEQAINGKTGMIKLGVHFSPIQSSISEANSETQLDYFRYSGLPLSNSSVALILILWLLGSFNYFARKELGRE